MLGWVGDAGLHLHFDDDAGRLLQQPQLHEVPLVRYVLCELRVLPDMLQVSLPYQLQTRALRYVRSDRRGDDQVPRQRYGKYAVELLLRLDPVTIQVV